MSKTPILASIDNYERSKIADTIKERSYAAGDKIIEQGADGDVFYIIISGNAVATKVVSEGQAAEEVMQYKEGDYFGELSLLKGDKRAANVIATSPMRVASIDRETFKRLLGPLDEILKRNMEAYSHYVIGN